MRQNKRERIKAQAGHAPLARRLRRLTAGDRQHEAREFIRLFYQECKGGGATKAAKVRQSEVARSLRKTGTYEHTYEELTYGARLSWRNHARCIGRLYWKSLDVIDRRGITDIDEMFEATQNHMKHALSDGRIRSTITIFPPAKPSSLPLHIESPQITQYACHMKKGGKTVGDKANLEATIVAQEGGWSGATGGAFDLLPVSLIDVRGRRVFRDIGEDNIRRIPLAHSEHPEFEALGLEWYAVPCISNMIMTIGGIDYPCAPFNGFYMSTEIASRNFVDPWRFDLLKTTAKAFGFDHGGDDVLWRDRTLTELNSAVIQSFDAANVTLIDHQSAGEQFSEFRARELAAGRTVHSDRAWIVPPQASSANPTFHLPLSDAQNVPNYYHSGAVDGRRMMPFEGDRQFGKFRSWVARKRRDHFVWKVD